MIVEKVLTDVNVYFDVAVAVPHSEVSFANAIESFMAQPNFKTNPHVSQVKHLQHFFTDVALRDAALQATTQLAACKKQFSQQCYDV